MARGAGLRSGQIDKIAVRQLKALPVRVKRNLRRISRGSMVCR